MTYNFDPERWHENEYSALEGLHKNGEITDIEFEEQRANLQRRYEEMLSVWMALIKCQNNYRGRRKKRRLNRT